MLIGEYARAIDAKGRTILPKEFRDVLEGGLVITEGLDNCLYIYPVNAWDKVSEKIMEMPEGKAKNRRFKRRFFSKANKLVPDGQGRILIPANLRGLAGLDKEALFVGVMDKVEVWNPVTWGSYDKSTEDAYEDDADESGV